MSLYLAAPAYSLLSEHGTKPIWITSAGDIDGKVILESQAARWSMALVSLLLFGYLVFSIFPQPKETPNYARFAPSELNPQKVFKVHPIKGNSKSNQDKPNSGKNKPGKPTK
jgi:hypothetical protein